MKLRYLKGKKAQGAFELGYKWPFYIIVGFFMAGLLFFLWWQISQYVSLAVVAPNELYTIAYTQRFMNSPHCFTYQDETGRAYPGVLDWDKFTDENLRQCFFTEEDDWKAGFQLTLQNLDTNDPPKIITTTNYYQFRERKSESILIQKDNKIFKGKLLIGLQ